MTISVANQRALETLLATTPTEIVLSEIAAHCRSLAKTERELWDNTSRATAYENTAEWLQASTRLLPTYNCKRDVECDSLGG